MTCSVRDVIASARSRKFYAVCRAILAVNRTSSDSTVAAADSMDGGFGRADAEYGFGIVLLLAAVCLFLANPDVDSMAGFLICGC